MEIEKFEKQKIGFFEDIQRNPLNDVTKMINFFLVQSSLCITITLVTQNLWLLLTRGRFSELKFDSNMMVVVAIRRWSLAQV
jgi:hypothetical protein